MTDNIKETRVRLVAANKDYQTAPVFLAPKFTEGSMEFDINGKKYKGKKITEGDEAIVIVEGMALRVSDVDSYKFSHLQEFVLGDEADELLLEIARGSGLVAKNKQSINPIFHRFYFEDREDDAKDTISKAELTFDAISRVKGLSAEEMEDYCRLLGENVTRLTKVQIEGKLMKIAYDKPKDLIDVFEDKNRKQKMFLRKLVERGTLRLSNGKYMYGTELVGANEDFAIQYLKDPNNNAMVTQWNQMMKRNTASAEVSEITEEKKVTTEKKGK